MAVLASHHVYDSIPFLALYLLVLELCHLVNKKILQQCPSGFIQQMGFIASRFFHLHDLNLFLWRIFSLLFSSLLSFFHCDYVTGLIQIYVVYVKQCVLVHSLRKEIEGLGNIGIILHSSFPLLIKGLMSMMY